MDEFLPVAEFFVDVLDGEHIEMMILAKDGSVHAICLTEEAAEKFRDDLLAAAAQLMKEKP